MWVIFADIFAFLNYVQHINPYIVFLKIFNITILLVINHSLCND